MAFALGVAIKNLFDRIAELLTFRPGTGTIGGISPLPPPLPGGEHPPPYIPPPSNGGVPDVIPPPIPQGPPPVVVIPDGPPLSPQEPPPEDCPLLTYSDRLAIYALQYREARQQQTLIPDYLPQVNPEEAMLSTIGLGTPVDANDVFRFRAISTVDNVAVSFFGRIQSRDGTITPFIRTLNTSTPNTLFETRSNTGPGLLLGAAASVPVGSITTGSVNAIGEIGRMAGTTFTPHTVLFSGQLDDQQALDSNLAVPATPVGRPTYIATSVPFQTIDASGVVITPNPGKKMRFVVFSAFFEMSATTFNRQPYAQIIPSVGVGLRFFGDRVFTAGQWCQMRFVLGGQPGTNVATQQALGILTGCPLPETLYFYEPVTVYIGLFTFANNDAGSLYTVIREET